MSYHSAPNTEDAIQQHLDRLLKARASPRTICPSEVARALSKPDLDELDTKRWRNVMPLVREREWTMRERGLVEVLQKGEVLGDDVSLDDVKGPIRVRLKQHQEA